MSSVNACKASQDQLRPHLRVLGVIVIGWHARQIILIMSSHTCNGCGAQVRIQAAANVFKTLVLRWQQLLVDRMYTDGL